MERASDALAGSADHGPVAEAAGDAEGVAAAEQARGAPRREAAGARDGEADLGAVGSREAALDDHVRAVVADGGGQAPDVAGRAGDRRILRGHVAAVVDALEAAVR